MPYLPIGQNYFFIHILLFFISNDEIDLYSGVNQPDEKIGHQIFAEVNIPLSQVILSTAYYDRMADFRSKMYKSVNKYKILYHKNANV